MKQQVFEQQNQALWERFERQLSALEKRRKKDKAAAESLDHFADHYRQICYSLALAQERQYSPHLIDHLNDLALRGHQHFYRRKGHILYNLLQFVLQGFPQAVRREYRFVWLGMFLFFVPALVMGGLTWLDPNLVYAVYGPDDVEEFVKMYDPANHAKFSENRGSSDDFVMFGFYIKNNIGIGFQTFASGILLGIGALFHLIFNGVAIGTVAGYLTELGHTETFWPFVVGHGAFELTGIAISGAAGLKLGYGLLCPGRLTRRQSLINAAREAMPLVYGVFFLLLIAAFVEAFWSSSTNLPDTAKYVAGASFWLLVISYLCLGVRRGS